MIENIKWYVLYTKPNQEKKAKEQLDKIEIENYLAVVTKTRRWSDRLKKVDEVLIKSYIFIKGDEKTRLTALELPSIVRCLYDRGRPAIVPDWQIQNLKNFLNRVGTAFVHNNSIVGRKVVIKEGPFAGIIGTIQKTLNGNLLSVSLDFINRSVTTIIPDDEVQFIEIYSDDIDTNENIDNKLAEKFLFT